VRGAPASLTSALLSRKGGAVTFGFLPAGRIDTNEPIVIPAAPTLLRQEAQRRDLPHSDTASRKPRDVVPRHESANRERPVRQTVRLDRNRHHRLHVAAAQLGSSASRLMIAALDHYLATVVPARVRSDCHCLQPVAADSGAPTRPLMPEPDP